MTITALRGPEGLQVLRSQSGPQGYELVIEAGPLAPELQQAWLTLSHVDELGPEALAAAWRVQLESVPAPGLRERPLAPLPRPARAPVASAAHPRAFRGTLAKPPKSPRPEPIDLRPYVTSRKGFDLLLRRLADDSALSAFDSAGLERARGSRHPYRAYWFPDADLDQELPEWVERNFLPLLRGQPWSQVRAFVALYWSLALGRRGGLAAAIVRLLLRSPDHALEWARHLQALPPSRRLVFALELLRSGGYRSDPRRVTGDQLEAFAERTLKRHWKADCNRWGRSMGNGMSMGFFLQSVSPRGEPRWRNPVDSGDCPDFDRAELGERAASLWNKSAQTPRLPLLLRSLKLDELEPDLASALVELIAFIPYEDSADREMRNLWLSEAAGLRERLLGIAPAYRERFLAELTSLVYEWEHPAVVRARLPLAYDYLGALCQPPMSTRVLNGTAIDQLAIQRRLPQSSYLAVEKACRRDSGGFLLSDGLRSALQRIPELTLDCLEHHPRPLLRAVKLLGGLMKNHRKRVLCDFLNHPMLLATELTPDLETLVRESCPRTIGHRLPLGRAHRLELCKLDVLTDLVIAAYRDLPLPGDADSSLHALRLLQGMDENRRPLRRFLRSWGSGDRGWLERHPATRKWLAAHPGLDLWTTGIEWTDPDLKCHLTLESDPLEILKMGTYVGSCLGLGGRLCDSAAAVVLDVNKQVVYARDPEGRFLARQHIAISRQGTLVCHSVYPLNINSALAQAFRDYDRRFASALGVELETSHTYDVELIVARDSWDDGLWSPA